MGKNRWNKIEPGLPECAGELSEIKRAEKMLDEYERRFDLEVRQMIAGLSVQLGQGRSDTGPLQDKITNEILDLRAETMREICSLRSSLNEKRRRIEEEQSR